MFGGAVLIDALRLEPWTPGDCGFWHRLNDDPRVVAFVGDGEVDPAASEELFAKILALRERPDPRFLGLWAVWEGDLPVGMAELKHTQNTAPGEAELIYALAPEAWGRGLGGRLVRALVARARERQLGVLATVHPENAASLRVLEREGFRRDGQLSDGTLLLRLGCDVLSPDRGASSGRT